MRLCPAFLCITCACTALAAPPEPKIAGPTKATPGAIVILDASESVADHFDWLIDDSGVQVPDNDATAAFEAAAEALRQAGFRVTGPKSDRPPTHVMLDNGKRVLLASYPGTYRISLAVGNAEGVRQLPWQVIIAGHGPQPPPNPPDPPVPPVPPVPPTPTNLTEQIAAAVKSAGLTSTEDTIEFAALAAIYGQTIPKEVTDGILKTIAATADRTKALTNLTLQRTMLKWKPGIVSIIERHLNAMQIPDNANPTVLLPVYSEVSAGILKGLK